MVVDLISFIDKKGRICQNFNGRTYRLYGKEKYLSTGIKKKWIRLHIAVWLHFGGTIKDGYDIHHKDGNKINNFPHNLEQKKVFDHRSAHFKKFIKDNPVWFKKFNSDGIKAASKWSKTKEGQKFRRDHYYKVLAKHNSYLHSRTVQKNCDFCGKPYKTTPVAASEARFCSNNCKSAWRRKQGTDNVQKVCITCGKEFTVNKYAKKVNCSRACSAKYAYKQRCEPLI